MNEIKVLDHGYVRFIEHYGSDERIIESARMSTDKGFLGWGKDSTCARCSGEGRCGPWGDSDRDVSETMTCPICKGTGRVPGPPGDERLLKYLYENKHSSPFEFAGLVVEIQAPIFVFREHHRHRTQSYNEMSARYTPLPDLNYIPSVERLMMNSKTNKQAGVVKGAEELTIEMAEQEREDLKGEYEFLEQRYQRALSRGVPKELARIRLPVGRYSKMRAATNLRNWLAFLTLRMAPNAQWEIRQYANAVGQYIQQSFPRTWELFVAGEQKCPST